MRFGRSDQVDLGGTFSFNPSLLSSFNHFCPDFFEGRNFQQWKPQEGLWQILRWYQMLIAAVFQGRYVWMWM